MKTLLIILSILSTLIFLLTSLKAIHYEQCIAFNTYAILSLIITNKLIKYER